MVLPLTLTSVLSLETRPVVLTMVSQHLTQCLAEQVLINKYWTDWVLHARGSFLSQDRLHSAAITNNSKISAASNIKGLFHLYYVSTACWWGAVLLLWELRFRTLCEGLHHLECCWCDSKSRKACGEAHVSSSMLPPRNDTHIWLIFQWSNLVTLLWLPKYSVVSLQAGKNTDHRGVAPCLLPADCSPDVSPCFQIWIFKCLLDV